MIHEKLTAKFVKHLLVTDLMVLLVIWCYNLLALICPVSRIRLGGIVLTLLILDAILVSVKLINNFNFGADR